MLDFYEGYIKKEIVTDCDSVVFFRHSDPLVYADTVTFRLIPIGESRTSRALDRSEIARWAPRAIIESSATSTRAQECDDAPSILNQGDRSLQEYFSNSLRTTLLSALAYSNTESLRFQTTMLLTSSSRLAVVPSVPITMFL